MIGDISKMGDRSGFRRLARLGLASALLAASTGCDLLDDKPGEGQMVSVVLKLKSVDEGGHPVAGTEVYLGKNRKGVSDANGVTSVSLKGQPGRSAHLEIRCPSGYASPEQGVTVGITPLAPGSPLPELETRCTALMRSIVVGIRAENGPNLPVLYLGKEVGRTDGAGTAHVALDLPPGETATLSLDTREAPALKPQNPDLVFKAGTRDELLLLDQKFTVTRKVVAVRRTARPTPL